MRTIIILYVMYVWIPSAKEEVLKATEKLLKGNRFAILAAESEEQVFSRQYGEKLSPVSVSPQKGERRAEKSKRKLDVEERTGEESKES